MSEKLYFTEKFLEAESRLEPKREAPKKITIPRWLKIGFCLFILALLASGWLYDLGLAGWK